MTDEKTNRGYIELTSDIVSAYVSNNSVPVSDIPRLIADTFSAVTQAASGQGSTGTTARAADQSPAVPIKKSVQNDYIVCLEDGKKFKTLKRHLSTVYGMSPEQYRAKWGLDRDYPMVAPAYAEQRSRLAQQIGLGKAGGARRGRKKQTTAAAAAA